MARKPKAEAANTDDRLKLIEALKFAAVAAKESDGKQNFVSIKDKWLMSSNDTFAMGMPVTVDIELCPHIEQFQAALSQCGQQYQLVQIDVRAVSIKSGKFHAVVPALPNDDMTLITPDMPCATINDSLRDAFAACLRVMGKGDKLYNQCVLLRANSMVATDGKIAIEYWHGIDLPGPLLIPKKTVETLAKLGKLLVGFGFSERSVTFWFDDNSFLKTQRCEGSFPDIDRLFLGTSGTMVPIWPEFYVGLKAIEAFIQGDFICFHSEYLATDMTMKKGANYRIEGMPAGYGFSAHYWRCIEPFVSYIGLGNPAQPMIFMGDKVRGLIAGRAVS